jgi:hypothetical protein
MRRQGKHSGKSQWACKAIVRASFCFVLINVASLMRWIFVAFRGCRDAMFLLWCIRRSR